MAKSIESLSPVVPLKTIVAKPLRSAHKPPRLPHDRSFLAYRCILTCSLPPSLRLHRILQIYLTSPDMLSCAAQTQLAGGLQCRALRRQLVVRGAAAATSSLRVPSKVDLEHLGRGANQEFPLNIHGVGKAGGWWCPISRSTVLTGPAAGPPYSVNSTPRQG
jgi:hypothetical protein